MPVDSVDTDIVDFIAGFAGIVARRIAILTVSIFAFFLPVAEQPIIAVGIHGTFVARR